MKTRWTNTRQYFKLLMLLVTLGFDSCARIKLNKSIGHTLKSVNEVRSQHLVIGDIQIHYMIAGSDSLPTMYFIHGSPGDWKAYSKYLEDEELLQHFRIAVFDRPGFGESTPVKSIHLDEQAKLLIAVCMENSNGKSCYLIGHSLGGPIAVLMAGLHPELFDGIALLAGSVCPALESPERWRNIFRMDPIRKFIPANLRRSNDEIFNFKKDIRMLDPCWDNITCPVLLIHGTKDPLVPFGNATYAMKRLHNSSQITLLKIVDANHFIPWEHFDTVKSSLVKYFNNK